MSDKNNPQIIEKDRVLDLTNPIKPKHGHKPKEGELKKRYESLKGKRESFLTRAREFSTYTIPSLYPYDTTSGDIGDGANTTGWQSFGADCVNAIVNKLVMTLFPPNHDFAKLELTPKAKALLKEEDMNVVEENGYLTNAQQQALLEHERIAGRVGMGEALEHLVVGGNACLYMPSEGNLITYPLSNYVCRRDKSGNLLELLIEETKSVDSFEPAVRAVILANQHNVPRDQANDEVTLFTRAKLKGGFYIVEEEVLGMPVGKKARLKKEDLPFIVLRWKSNYGEDYGRSLVEQHAGDFHVIQVLSEAIAKGMILMSDIKYLVRQGSVTDLDHLIESPTGEFVYGNIEDIGVLQIEKQADFNAISSVLDKYERRTGEAFMKGVQRDAERVTAYEVRRDALQMENSLGGAYSLLAVTLQKPYFKLLLNRIDFNLPANLVNTVITTGIEALSKMGDADKFVQWSEAMVTASQLPAQIQERIKWGDFATHTANQLALPLDYMMTEEEYQQQAQAQQQAQQQAQMTEGVAKAIPQVLSNSNKQ